MQSETILTLNVSGTVCL